MFRLLCFVIFSSNALGAINLPLQKNVEPPLMLSETGLFQNNGTDLVPTEELLPYEVNQPLWTDFAKKQRWIYLPEGKKIDFDAKDFWRFPVGTIIVKHFKMETARHQYQNIETRILVRLEGESEQNWGAYTYQWSARDARLVSDGARPQVVIDVDDSAAGGRRTQEFNIPDRQQCLGCHNVSVGFARSVRTQQINRLANGINQLDQWNQAKMFANDIGLAKKYEAYGGIDDAAKPLEQRVKAYFDVNCSHCHNPSPAAPCYFTGIDFRFGTFKLESLIRAGLIVPGRKVESEIFRRMESTRPFYRMPYIGSIMKDDSALAVIGQWIDSLQH